MLTFGRIFTIIFFIGNNTPKANGEKFALFSFWKLLPPLPPLKRLQKFVWFRNRSLPLFWLLSYFGKDQAKVLSWFSRLKFIQHRERLCCQGYNKEYDCVRNGTNQKSKTRTTAPWRSFKKSFYQHFGECHSRNSCHPATNRNQETVWKKAMFCIIIWYISITNVI